MNISAFFLFVNLVIVTFFLGCASPRPETTGTPAQELTVGTVQKQIHVGMSQTAVAEALGSPNIVTRDSDGKETWVYDKMATEVSSDAHAGYANIVILGASKNRQTVTTSQNTLTVLIKFDAKNAVESYTFHASRF